MLLNVGEHHLDRCHSELVWPQEHDRHPELLVVVHHIPTTMVRGIVNQKDSLQPPVAVLLIEMGT